MMNGGSLKIEGRNDKRNDFEYGRQKKKKTKGKGSTGTGGGKRGKYWRRGETRAWVHIGNPASSSPMGLTEGATGPEN